MSEQVRMSAQNISKAFGNVQALDKVDFELRHGEIHGLLGENGAGKSTFIEIMAGDLSADQGVIFYEGCPADLRSRPTLGIWE